MTKPNEVMDDSTWLEDIDSAMLRRQVRLKVNDAYQCGADGITDIDTVNAALELATAQILALIAQQNAALLRELLAHKGVIDWVENGQIVKSTPDKYVPASILEAKLNEITEEER